MENYIKKKWKYIVTIIFSVITVIVMIAFNCNKKEFFDANFIQIITFVYAIFITFLYVQLKGDRHRKINSVEKIINDIQEKLNIDIVNTDPKEVNLILGSIGNKIQYIKEGNVKEIKEDIEYVDVKFTEMKELYGSHFTNKEELKSIQNDILRIKTNIDDKCTKIIMKLYDI